ncbi:properdin [Emys orbicularis]|uniref:properdin n=1 Tax=Emys orbicularis TaxID=82168 RepID=UPI0031FC73F7
MSPWCLRSTNHVPKAPTFHQSRPRDAYVPPITSPQRLSSTNHVPAAASVADHASLRCGDFPGASPPRLVQGSPISRGPVASQGALDQACVRGEKKVPLLPTPRGSGAARRRPDAQEGLCYEDFGAGKCKEFLGEDVSKEDCCQNPNYGYRPRAGAPCQSCRQAEWSDWTPWSPCSVSCEEGVQRRSQACLGQGQCSGGPRKRWEIQACSLKDCCPVMGGWSAWGPWSSCSVTCAEGVKKRVRRCTEPAPICGGSCPGPDSETMACDTNKICPTHGNWGSWGQWGPCSATCSPEDVRPKPQQRRWRVCNNPLPSVIPLGLPCIGSTSEDQSCPGLPFCPVDGGWNNWETSSPCSVTCGLGRVTQKRLCNNPAPRHGGKACLGLNTRSHFCNTKIPCPVDGRWSEWGEWSTCTRPGYHREHQLPGDRGAAEADAGVQGAQPRWEAL